MSYSGKNIPSSLGSTSPVTVHRTWNTVIHHKSIEQTNASNSSEWSIKFCGWPLLLLLSLLWFLSHFSLPLHCLISLGHFSLMSDHAVISVGSSYLTPGSLPPKPWISVAYNAERILCAFGVLLSVLCQWPKDSFKVSYSNKELDPSSVGVLRDNCFTVISEVTPGHIAHIGLSLSRWSIWSLSYTEPPGFCLALTGLRLVAKKYRFYHYAATSQKLLDFHVSP